MIKSTTYYDIVKILRNEVIKQSGLDPNSVINAVTARGPDLLDMLNNLESYSFDLKDSFIVFELIETTSSDDNYYTTELDDSLSSYTNYNFKMIIYGNYSHDLGQTLLLRFRSASVSLDLRNQGIYIKDVDYPISNNEFINNTYWPRVDMSINIQTRFNIDQIHKPDTIGGETPIDENAKYIKGLIVRDFEKANKNREN